MKLTNLIDRLVAFEPDGFPFISIYLDASPNTSGRDAYQAWLKKEISDASESFDADSAESKALDASIERVQSFLDSDVEAGANGIAIFASSGQEDFFETVQIDEPFPNNRFFIFDRPHIFPLARLVDQNPRYAVLWADTNKADIYVFGGENTIDVETDTSAKVEEIQGEKTNRSQVGGWSQARYQRHIENFHLQHAKETVEELEKLMDRTGIEHVILCGDEATIMPVLQPQLSKETEECVTGVLNIGQYASEQEIRDQTAEVMATHKEAKDKECVERMFGAAKAAAGLGTIGVENTLAALSNGQVEELVVSSAFDSIKYNTKGVEKILDDYAAGSDNSAATVPEASEKRQVADEIIIRAINSAAKICFIDDESLLKEAGGVGAVLRYNMNASAGG